jgi:SAM-dependent methyltransferase
MFATQVRFAPEKIRLVSADDGFFGERAAAVYDERAAEMFDPAVVTPVVDLLAELAGDGSALEFGIGTGRIALPLAERGVRVHGIDSSDAMVARLREKPRGEEIGVTIGDFATTRVDGEFSLAYLVFNTIFNLVTQDAQVACFENAAAHLTSGGRFVIETGVPELQRLPPGETIIPFRAEPDGISFDVYDVVTQRFSSQHYVFARGPGGGVSGRVPLRVAGGARPDGAPGGDEPGGPLGRVAAGAFHEPESVARLRVRAALSRPKRGGAHDQRHDRERPRLEHPAQTRSQQQSRRRRGRATTRRHLTAGQHVDLRGGARCAPSSLRPML